MKKISSSGGSLLEVLIVCVIVGIILSITLPVFRGDKTPKEAVRQVKEAVKEVQAKSSVPDCAPQFKPGDKVQTVLAENNTNKIYTGLVITFDGTDTNNGACVYTVRHYKDDGTNADVQYFEFELTRAL